MPLAAHTEEEEDMLLAQAAEASEGFSGAELEGLCR
jgi:SpoVK/Ycf46/Vps4 family AAA+-type ATPase